MVPRRQARPPRVADRSFGRAADEFHNTLRAIGFDDDPRFAGVCRFAMDLRREDAAINVGALTPPSAGAVGLQDNPRFHIRITKVRGRGRGGVLLGEWAFEANTVDGVPEIVARALYRILILAGGPDCTLCPECGGSGYVKSLWRPADPVLTGGFRWCIACERTGDRTIVPEGA